MAVLVLFCPRLVLFPLELAWHSETYLFKELASGCICVCGELVCRSAVLEPARTLLSCPGRGGAPAGGTALPGAPPSPAFLDLPPLSPARDGGGPV